jgi:hypothetical protein
MPKISKSKRRANATGRTMAEGKHVRLHEWLLRSRAWHELGPHARLAYVEFCRLYNGQNNGELFLSEREAAARLGCNPKTAAKALKQLVEWGFIRPVVKGSFHWKERHATDWLLTEFAYGNALPTKDFMKHGPWAGNKPRHHHAVQTAPLGGADGAEQTP